jgi:Na+/melibiose symporter-like transporter
LSDRTTSRFGRRWPWLFVGTILSALALAALIISMSHSYLALYATGAVIAVPGMLSVFPIRSVR